MSKPGANRPEPLAGHPRYEKVRLSAATAAAPERSSLPCTTQYVCVRRACEWLQIKDLNSGTFGFVQLARDKATGETWAVKFIERGDKVR